MHKKIKLSKSNLLLKVVAYVVMGAAGSDGNSSVSAYYFQGIQPWCGCNGGQCSILAERFSTRNGVVCTDENIIFKCIENSLIVTIGGTAISMFTTITTAYPLSKPSFKGRKVFTLLYVISMVFFGGMIPAYMVVRTLGLIDTYAACILPFAIVQFNMFIVKNYFEGLPEEVEESAWLDGAGDIRTLTRIVCPMSTPVLATVSLLYAITYWNNYFHAMMYTKSAGMQTMQVYLYNIINNSQEFAENLASGSNFMANITSEGLVAATVTLSIIPIVILYPFVARFMVQGITVGSVKG